MVKEVASYETEAKENEAKVQKMRDDGKDPYDIRKQEEVLGLYRHTVHSACMFSVCISSVTVMTTNIEQLEMLMTACRSLGTTAGLLSAI